MKLKLVILFLLTSFTGAYAQNARAILDKASEAYNSANGITANFTLDSKDRKSNMTYSYDGKAYMKGDKFKIEIPEAITWFDGKTQWVYIKDTEEVNVTTPSGDELQGISPSVLFSIYKKGFKLSYSGERKVAGKTVLEVTMIAQNKAANVAKIIVQIDKATNLFSKITMIDKSGIENILSIKNLKAGTSLSDSTFSFDIKNYPQAEIIDLR